MATVRQESAVTATPALGPCLEVASDWLLSQRCTTVYTRALPPTSEAGSVGSHHRRRALQASTVPPGAESLGMELCSGLPRGDVRGAGEGTAGSAMGAGRRTEGGAHRQPVSGHPRAEGQERPCPERQVRGRSDPLWSGVHQDQPTLFSRERRGRAGTPPPEERHRSGPHTQGEPGLRVRAGVRGVRQRSRRPTQQAGGL